MIYYSIFVSISAFSFFDFIKRNKYSEIFVLFFFLFVLSIFSGLRGPYVGPDYSEYIKIFRNVSSLPEVLNGGNNFSEVHGETLFLFFNSVVKYFTNNSLVMFYLVSLFSIGINLINYRKYSPYFVLTVLLYFSHYFIYKEFIQIRNGLASAILLFSIPYIEDRRFIKFMSVICIASLIHSGSIILILVFPLFKIKFTQKKVFFVLLLSAIIGSTSWVHNILYFLKNYGILPQSILNYLGSDKYDYSIGLFNPITVKQLIVLLFLTKYYYPLIKKIEYFKSMYYLYLLSTIWLILFNDFAILASRIASFFSIVDVILVPVIIIMFKQKGFIYLSIFLFSLLMLYLNIDIKHVLNTYSFAF